MTRLSLKSVSIQGFRSFVEKQTIADLQSTGLYGIRGHNLDTGGSSGAGKSSVILGICYALGILKTPFTAAKLESKWGDKPLQVDLELDSPEGTVLLRRGKATSIKVGEEPLISGSVKAVDERLERLIGLDADLLRALTFRQQKKPGLFLTMKDAEKKAFLSKLLGTEELESQQEATVAISAKCRYEIGTTEEAIKILRGQLVDVKPVVLTSVADLETNRLTFGEARDYALRSKDQKVTDLEAEQRAAQSEWASLHSKLQKEKEAFEIQLQEKVRSRPPRPPVEESEDARQLRQAVQVCHERIVEQEKLRQSAINSAQKSRDDASLQLRRVQEAIGKEPNLQKQLVKVRADIEQAESQQCPTCSQQWVSTQAKLQEWRKTEADLVGGLALVETAKASLEAAQQSFSRATEALGLATNDASVTNVRQVLAEVKQRLAAEIASATAASELYDSQMKIEDQAIVNARRTLELEHAKLLSGADVSRKDAILALKTSIQEFHAQVNEIQGRMDRLDFEIKEITLTNRMESERAVYQREQNAKFQSQIAAKEVELHTLNLGLNAEYDFAAFLKSFLGAIFDEVLQEISDESNDILKSLKNTQTTTITFMSERITEKGAMKQQIRPVVLKNGVELDPEAELSGGQQTSLEMAVDLAMGRVIGRRTGKRPGWSLIDEGFDGMDLVTQEAAMEMLQVASQDCAIYVISHSSEFKEYFSRFIDVESQNEISRIVS